MDDTLAATNAGFGPGTEAMGNDWREELGKILDSRSKTTRAELEKERFEAFVAKVARPALGELAGELGRHGRKAVLRETTASITLTVMHGDTEEISFRLLARSLPAGLVPYAEIRLHKGQRLVKTEGKFKHADPHCTIDSVTVADVIVCFLAHYRQAVDVVV